MKKLYFLCFLLVLCLTTAGASSPEDREVTPSGYVALTFDDGPSGKITQKLLDGLRQRDARATFFLCGYRMEQYPDLMDRYLAEGHEIGLHTTIHSDLTALTRQELHEDFKSTAQKVFVATGRRSLLLRPPGGAWNETVLQEAKDQGLSVILWSVDSRDWANHNASAVVSAMSSKVKSGDIILMHDMSMSSVTAALRLVDDLQKDGYSFVTVSELAALTGEDLAPGVLYRHFPP